MKASHFSHLARRVSWAAGHPAAFFTACTVVLVWALTGPLFGFSDTWQLVINTGTTVVTFLMVFLIQNGQNRDMVAIHLKLDELVRAIKEARNSVMDLENLDEAELERMLTEYRQLAGQRCAEATEDRVQELPQTADGSTAATREAAAAPLH